MPPEAHLDQASWLTTVPMPLRSLLRVMEVGPGEATVALEPQPWMGSTMAAAALLADDALGLATTGAMPLGSLAVTVELTIDAVGPVPDSPTTLIARTEARYADAEGGVGTGAIADDSGREFALVSVRTIIGRKLDPDEAFAEVTAGEFVPPSAAQQLRAIPGLANSSGFVHGGVIAIAGIHAAERELGSLGTAGIRIFYARPISADGSELRIDPTVVHRGRRAGLARVEVRPAGGDQVAAWMMVAGVGKENASNQGGSDG